jgi:outer membrane murein-binding lipoprotein Lpp
MEREKVFAQVRTLLRGSELTKALELLEQYLKANPKDADAWWLAAHSVASRQKQLNCVERVLKISPSYAGARERLAALNGGKTFDVNLQDLDKQIGSIIKSPPEAEINDRFDSDKSEDDFELLPVVTPRLKASHKTPDVVPQFASGRAPTPSLDRIWLIGMTATQGLLILVIAIFGLTQLLGSPRNSSQDQLSTIEKRLNETATQIDQKMNAVQTAMSELDDKVTKQFVRIEGLESSVATLSQQTKVAGTVSNRPPTPIAGARPNFSSQGAVNPRNNNPMPVAEKAASEDVIVKLPQPVVDAVPVAGGKLIVLRFENSSVLMLFDPIQRKLAGSITLPSANFVFAAGGERILVYFKENNLLNVFDVNTKQSIKSRPNPIGTTVTTLTMGHNLGDLALVRCSEGTDQLSRARDYLLDVNQLQESTADQAADKNSKKGQTNSLGTSHNISFRDAVHRRANGDLTMVTEWCTSHSPQGIGLLFPQSHGDTKSRYEHNSVGYLAMGDDDRVYAQSGEVYTSQLVSTGKVSGTPVPGLGGAVFLVAQNGVPSIFQSGTTRPLAPLSPLKDCNQQMDPWGRNPFAADRRIVFAPALGYVLYFPLSNNEAIVRPFNLENALQKSGVDYLVVTSVPARIVAPGRTWTYQLNVLSKTKTPVKYTLQTNPDGMAISTSGKITWDVPSSLTIPQKVVVLVETTGDSTFHTFELAPEA